MRKAILAAVLALAACGGDEERDHPCTLIACFDGLRVTVANPPMEAYRVVATAAGQTTPQVRNCNAGGCFILFEGLFPDQVTIQIVLTASGTVERSANASPNYVIQQSNGPGCGTCRNATVAL